MGNSLTIFKLTVVLIFLFSFGVMSGNYIYTEGTDSDQTSSTATQTKPKTTQTGSKSGVTNPKTTQPSSKSTPTKSSPVKSGPVSQDKPVKDVEAVKIGSQSWALANLNVNTFRNGDSIPEARTNAEWEILCKSGKPAWCYYNNNPANGLKYGKLYNWYAVNDPRELAPEGWVLPADADWIILVSYLGGPDAAGIKMKTTTGWNEGSNGTNQSGFSGLPGGYRIENGTFQNLGNIGTWWTVTESKALNAIDFYLALRNRLEKSSSSKQRGESVRCLRK
jgi:uncharacterized protein (TIGR02145 family)